jgi:opacity protein-like surface antigen
MKRILVAAVMVASFVSISSARMFEVGITGSYGLGLGDSTGKNIHFDASGAVLEKFEDVYLALGNGIKVLADVTFYLNESFGIMAMGGYSTGGGYTTEENYGTWGQGFNVKTSYIPINLGIKIRGSSMGGIRPYAYIAPGIYLPKRDDTTSLTGALAPPVGTPGDHVTYKFGMGWGFTAGVGAEYSITDRINIKLEVSPTIANANITQYTLTHGQSGIKETYIFQNDAKTFPPNPPMNTYYRHGQPRNRFNSLDFRLGASFGF